MKVTIKDIAKLAGVSTTTVSKILNKKDDTISQATREKVKRIMKENNYVPNTIARSMVTKKTNTIGLVIPDIRNPFFPELARGAEDKANEAGYNIMICNTDDSVEKEQKYLDMLLEKMVDGIILTAASSRIGGSGEIKCGQTPIVLVDRDIDIKGINRKIIVNDMNGAYEGTRHLLESGYKNPMLISGPLSTKTSTNRLEGFKKALMEEGIHFNEENVIYGAYKSGWGYEAVKILIEKGYKFDALLCANDLIAIGAIKALQERNIKVPEEVGVVGFDDIYMAKLIRPELTTIKQPNYEMGYKAVEMIIKQHNNKERNLDQEVLETRLVIRKSTRMNK